MNRNNENNNNLNSNATDQQNDSNRQGNGQADDQGNGGQQNEASNLIQQIGRTVAAIHHCNQRVNDAARAIELGRARYRELEADYLQVLEQLRQNATCHGQGPIPALPPPPPPADERQRRVGNGRRANGAGIGAGIAPPQERERDGPAQRYGFPGQNDKNKDGVQLQAALSCSQEHRQSAGQGEEGSSSRPRQENEPEGQQQQQQQQIHQVDSIDALMEELIDNGELDRLLQQMPRQPNGQHHRQRTLQPVQRQNVQHQPQHDETVLTVEDWPTPPPTSTPQIQGALPSAPIPRDIGNEDHSQHRHRPTMVEQSVQTEEEEEGEPMDMDQPQMPNQNQQQHNRYPLHGQIRRPSGPIRGGRIALRRANVAGGRGRLQGRRVGPPWCLHCRYVYFNPCAAGCPCSFHRFRLDHHRERVKAERRARNRERARERRAREKAQANQRDEARAPGQAGTAEGHRGARQNGPDGFAPASDGPQTVGAVQRNAPAHAAPVHHQLAGTPPLVVTSTSVLLARRQYHGPPQDPRLPGARAQREAQANRHQVQAEHNGTQQQANTAPRNATVTPSRVSAVPAPAQPGGGRVPVWGQQQPLPLALAHHNDVYDFSMDEDEQHTDRASSQALINFLEAPLTATPASSQPSKPPPAQQQQQRMPAHQQQQRQPLGAVSANKPVPSQIAKANKAQKRKHSQGRPNESAHQHQQQRTGSGGVQQAANPPRYSTSHAPPTAPGSIPRISGWHVSPAFNPNGVNNARQIRLGQNRPVQNQQGNEGGGHQQGPGAARQGARENALHNGQQRGGPSQRANAGNGPVAGTELGGRVTGGQQQPSRQQGASRAVHGPGVAGPSNGGARRHHTDGGGGQAADDLIPKRLFSERTRPPA